MEVGRGVGNVREVRNIQQLIVVGCLGSANVGEFLVGELGAAMAVGTLVVPGDGTPALQPRALENLLATRLCRSKLSVRLPEAIWPGRDGHDKRDQLTYFRVAVTLRAIDVHGCPRATLRPQVGIA